MITDGIEDAASRILEDIFYSGTVNIPHESKLIQDKKKDLIALMRAEAINLADSIIGKDRILHSRTDSHGNEYLDIADKAVYDFQVAQRVKLAEYHKQSPAVRPEQIVNTELSENEE